MKKFKLLSLSLLVCTSFVAGQMFAPNANTAKGGTADDPAVSKSYLNGELGKINTTITSLEKTIDTLENKIKTLQSDVDKLEAGSGGSSSGSSSSAGSSSTSYIGTATITANTLNVRSGAGTSYSSIGSLKKGDKVKVIKKSGTWYQIQFTSSKTGWISADYVNYTANNSNSGSTTTNKTGVVTANSLNVRSGAGTSYSKVGALSKNAKVEITQTSGSWYKIKSGSIVGWVSSEYIKLT